MSVFDKLVTPEQLPPHQVQLSIPAPVSGKVDTLSTLSCPLFAQRLFGEGVAISPSGFQVLAPFEGKVMSLANTFNEIRLQSKQGVQLHIQLGMQSERMLGDGFKSHVKQGDRIKSGQILLEFDLRKMKQALDEPTFAVTILNSDKLKGVVIHPGRVTAGEDPVMTLLI